MHYKGEKHWKKLSLTAGLREIVNNRELCICIVFRGKKAAKPGEKRSKSVVPEGSRGRGSRVQSSSSLVQESVSGRGSGRGGCKHCLPQSGGCSAAAGGALQRWGASPQAACSSSVMLHGHLLHQFSLSWQISSRKKFKANKTFEGKPQILRRAVSSHQTCVLVHN